MNKQHPAFAWRRTALLLLLLSTCLLRSLTVAADETDLYHESLKFDSNGNLLMTTRDKKADSLVRYRTIGWVVKRTPQATGSTTSIRLKLEQNGASHADPTDPNYIFTYFKCDHSLIFEKIGMASADWQRSLYQNGGTVYLDAIMTVVENGRALGYMDASGILHGEVYTTASGIMNARPWADPEALRTHYNKAVLFPAIKELFTPEEGKDEKERLRISYGQEFCQMSNYVSVRAAPKEDPAFEVAKGIPTGEDVFASGKLQKYYYQGALTHYYGTVPVPVEIAVTYTYTVETEEGIKTESFTSNSTYYVNREYSYYRFDELKLCTLKRIFVENEALPVLPLELADLYTANVVLERNRGSYMEIPSYHTSVYGGDLSSGFGISGEQLEGIAQQTAGEVKVRNDLFVIDGETILDGSFTYAHAPEPNQPRGARLLPFQSNDLTIPHTKRNSTYDTYAVAEYRDMFRPRVEQQEVQHVNSVVVHTPVVCKGGITDDTRHNQQFIPTKHFSLVLGRSFAVGISTVGTHKDQKGYGTRDYQKYTQLRQIRFPFEVYAGDVHYEKDTWIDLMAGDKLFYLPVGVHEGDYKIRYRTIAKNAAAQRGGIDCNGYLANLELKDYGAYDELTVTVIGRMYDFVVTDIVDYPRWRSVFYGPDGSKRSFAFWVGRNNLEGEESPQRKTEGILPILPGDHPFNQSARAVGLGYQVKLQLKTIGDMRGGDDMISLVPTYYYISRDGSRRQRVRLYRKKDLSEVYAPLTLTSSSRRFLSVQTRNVSDPLLRAQSVQVWDGTYQLSPDLCLVDAEVDLDSYIRQHGGRIGQRDPVFLREGYLLVQFEIYSYKSGTVHLSYVNRGNSDKGYCNMWRLQGFVNDRADVFGNHFSFVDGDCLLFDTKYMLHSDYESWGTH